MSINNSQAYLLTEFQFNSASKNLKDGSEKHFKTSRKLSYSLVIKWIVN